MLDDIRPDKIPTTNIKPFVVGQGLFYTTYIKKDKQSDTYSFSLDRFGTIVKLNPDGGFTAEMEFHTKNKTYLYTFKYDELNTPIKNNNRFLYILTTYDKKQKK